MLKLKISSLIIMLLILSVFIYGFFISLSDRRSYGKLSIDNFFLTPKDLAKIANFCKDSPAFIYSSADGTKPAITSLTCEADETKTLNYLRDNEFSFEPGSIDKLDGSYKKKDVELEISRNKEKNLYKITFFEYL